MLEFFSELEIGDSEKLRILLLGGSAITAITVVFINQWFNRRRESHALKVEKIELLYETANELEMAAYDITVGAGDIYELRKYTEKEVAIEEIERLEKVCEISYLKLKNSFHKINMLTDLYFNGAGFVKATRSYKRVWSPSITDSALKAITELEYPLNIDRESIKLLSGYNQDLRSYSNYVKEKCVYESSIGLYVFKRFTTYCKTILINIYERIQPNRIF